MPPKKRHAGWSKPKRKKVAIEVNDRPTETTATCEIPASEESKDVSDLPEAMEVVSEVDVKKPRKTRGKPWNRSKGTKQGSQRNKKEEPVIPCTTIENSNNVERELTQRSVTLNIHVIRGTISQDNARYGLSSRNKQCTPIAVVALAYNRVSSFSAWDATVIDAILDYGDELYLKSIALRMSRNFANDSSHPYLMLNEVRSKFIIQNYGFHICFDETNSVNGRVVEESEGPFSTLADGLPQVFQNYESAVFTCNSTSVCVCKSSADYFLFDSHSRGADGKPVESGGTACLIKFRDVGSLLRFLTQSYPPDVQYCLSPIEVRVESTVNLTETEAYVVLDPADGPSSPVTPPINVDFIQNSFDSINLCATDGASVTEAPPPLATVVRDAAPRHQEVPLNYLGKMDVSCVYCGALFFRNENPICCQKGAVRVADGPEYPELLKALITNMHPRSRGFMKNIRRYNTLLAMGSTTATLRQDLGRGVPVVVVSGQIYHRVADVDVKNPRFGSLYFLDSGEALRARISNASVSGGCDPGLLDQIDALLRTTHPYARMYQSLGQKVRDERRTYGNDRIPEIGLYFKNIPGTNRSVYAAPTTLEEIGAVFSSVDGNLPPPDGNVRVFYRENANVGYQDIPKMSPIVDTLCYPILYPFGQLGWAMDMPRSNATDRKRKRVSKREFDRYRLMVRKNRFNPIHHAGKLAQQFIVDKYAELEGDRLHYLRTHQKDVRADSYEGLQDHVARRIASVQVDERIGRVVILPSTFQGGPRFMHQKYQDAMAIVAKFGRPCIFLTFTCNPKWREIRENMNGELLNPQDRPDIVARVFDLKRRVLFEALLEKNMLGKVIAYVYVVEFQKRGLPHVHMILFMADADKLREPEDVDRLISAELPAAGTRLFDTIVSSMIHGPCGDRCQNSPCMEDGSCTKRYPKEFSEHTVIDGRRPVYRRRNDGRTATLTRRGVTYTVDNRDVVPYNAQLCELLDAHINVELITNDKVVKYVFKYLHKGPDAAVILPKNERIEIDEIQDFEETRFLPSGEAAHKLLGLSMHGMSPSVMQLPVHLPGERSVCFVEGEEAEAIRNQEGKLSFLEAFFELNAVDRMANRYLYCEIPLHYCWVAGRWKRRSRKYKIVTRMFTISPRYVEKFHLRILLSYVRGPKSFEDLRTYDGTVYPTFREAARARLLVSSDEEWERTLEHAALVQMPRCMRKLFAYLLCYCEVADPPALWSAFKSRMCEDFLRRGLSTERAENAALRGIQTVLRYLGRTLADFNLPDCSSDSVADVVNDDADVEPETSGDFDPDRLNPDQRGIFERVVGAVESSDASSSNNRLFYLQGSGGTGKTHLYNTILTLCRTKRIPTLAVAFTGIAALLLRNGRTVHSTFKLPLHMDADSRSSIKAQSEEAAALRKLRLIIWDEVSMASYHVLDAVDRLLQDVRADPRPFGGLCVLLGGDVKQLLPVAAGRVRQVELFFTNCRSWSLFEVLRLRVNVRTDAGEEEFARWLEELGLGTLNERVIDDANEFVRLPDRCLTSNVVEEVFGGSIGSLTAEQLASRAILCPRNEHCNRLNDDMLRSFPGKVVTLLSSDSVASGDEVETANYQVEYLNSLTPSGMPLHELRLKVGVPVILLRNLSLADGLINGTRLLVSAITDLLLTAKIVTGRFTGSTVLIPRMDLTSSDNTIPVTLKRRQFPVKLCFALTINKAQGQTFDKVGIYLGNPVFSHGQLYVAFSRARNWDAVKVKVEPTKHQGRLLPFSKDIFTKNIVFGTILNSIK